MTTEQLIIRWLMVVPTLLLMLWFLPVEGGGFQYGGIIDGDFLVSGAVDFAKLVFEIAAVLILWLLFEQYGKRSMDL
ncbi:MAG: hypothetical protein ACYDCO_24110 [Armatimonadota bacterium]